MIKVTVDNLYVSFLISGFPRDPKFGHLRDVHRALKLCKKALFKGVKIEEKINEHVKVSYFYSLICA